MKEGIEMMGSRSRLMDWK